MMPFSSQSIGVFDSGIGGLTVLKSLTTFLPHESFIYLGDTARLPYGNKPPEMIVSYALENSAFLLEKEIKLLVIACHTASAIAFSTLRHTLPIPVLDVIEPSITQAIATTKNKKIAILATKNTIASQVYQKRIKDYLPDAEVFGFACPLLVPLIEEQWVNHPATTLIVQEYLKPLKELDIDTLILGCTHYPLLQDLIQKELSLPLTIIDSSLACAKQVAHLMQENNMHNESKQTTKPRYFVSHDPLHFQRQARQIMQDDGLSVHCI